MSPRGSVDRATALCSGDHGLIPVGTQISSLSYARVMVINSPFTMFHLSLPSSKFTIFTHLSRQMNRSDRRNKLAQVLIQSSP